MQTFPKTVMWQAVLGLGFNGFVLYVTFVSQSEVWGGYFLILGYFECLQYIMYIIWRFMEYGDIFRLRGQRTGYRMCLTVG